MKKAADVVMECLKYKDLTQAEISRRMGEKPQNLNEQLHRQDMKTGRFAEVMEHIGYDVIVMDRGFSRVTPEYGMSVIQMGEPHGLFWYRDGGLYIGIDSRCGRVLTETFPSFREMQKWFKDRQRIAADDLKNE